MRTFGRLLSVFTVLVALIGSPAGPASAAAPPGPFFQGFENNTNGWFDGSNRNIVRRPSGWVPTSGSSYAPGVPSAAGRWHARLEDNGFNCTLNCDGPFTRWGGYSAAFPPRGYKTQIDIYLDATWAARNHIQLPLLQDYRVEWISALNDNTGTFERDFVFNIGTTPTGYIVQSSTNSTRSGANPNSTCPSPSAPPNTCRPPVFINASGWYTFRHTFRDGGDGFLDVDFDIFALGNPTSIIHETIDGDHGTDSDPMSRVGGNRYGWFSNEEVPDLAIDNTLRTGLCHSHDGDGDVQGNSSGKGHFHSHAKSCEGQEGQPEGDVEESDAGSGTNFQSTTISSATFTADENRQTLTMIGTGTDNGLPVAFTLVAVDNGVVGPGFYSLLLSDGYAVTGTLIDGTLTIA
jgi:hypothetical protein